MKSPMLAVVSSCAVVLAAAVAWSCGDPVHDAQVDALGGATVTIYDATQLADGGAPRTVVTNAAGNFYIRRTEWSPFFPLHDIAITYPGVDTPTLMHTNVGRDGSCGSCHFDPKSANTHGHVYLVLEAADFPGATP